MKNINSLTLREKIASIFMFHVPGKDANVFADFVSKYRPAGIILMEDNIPAKSSELKRITSAIQQGSLPLPLLIAIDQEGGIVKRIKNDKFLAASDLRNKDPNETSNAFKGRSFMLIKLGINFNFGIVADVTINEDSFIYGRVFGSDPKLVGEHVKAALRGSKKLIFSTLKHFPGHGATALDSHATIPLVKLPKGDWLKKDFLPFRMGIDQGTEAIMFGHLIYKDVDDKPASLSLKWHFFLCKEIGYKGITVTDDMIMLQMSGKRKYRDPIENAISAINAGNDIILFVNDYSKEPIRQINIDRLMSGVEAAVKAGNINEDLLNLAVKRVIQHRKKIKTLKI